MQRIDAVKAVSRNLRDLIVDTVPASLWATGVDVAKLIHPVTNQLQGRDFYIYSGAGNGQERTIVSFSPDNNRITFDEALGSIPSVNSNFLIFDFFRKDEYDNAIDRMIGMSEFKYLQDYVATISIAGSQYEYVVPSGFLFVNNLRLVPSGGSDYETEDYANRIFELPPHYWHIEINPLGSYLLTFDPRLLAMDNFDGDAMRIRGQSRVSVGTTDTSNIPKDLEEYIIQGASMLLASQRISENQEWRLKFAMFQTRTQQLEDYIYKPRRGKAVG